MDEARGIPGLNYILPPWECLVPSRPTALWCSHSRSHSHYFIFTPLCRWPSGAPKYNTEFIESSFHTWDGSNSSFFSNIWMAIFISNYFNDTFFSQPTIIPHFYLWVSQAWKVRWLRVRDCAPLRKKYGVERERNSPPETWAHLSTLLPNGMCPDAVSHASVEVPTAWLLASLSWPSCSLNKAVPLL